MNLITFSARGTIIVVEREIAEKAPKLHKLMKNRYDCKEQIYVDCDPKIFHMVLNFLVGSYYKVPLKYVQDFGMLGVCLGDHNIKGEIISCHCGLNFEATRQQKLQCQKCEYSVPTHNRLARFVLSVGASIGIAYLLGSWYYSVNE